MEEKCLHYVGNSIQRTSINYNEVLDNNEQHSLPHLGPVYMEVGHPR